MPDLSETIEALAAVPIKSVVDGQEVQERTLADLIAADEYLKANVAKTKTTRGIFITKLLPPGAA